MGEVRLKVLGSVIIVGGWYFVTTIWLVLTESDWAGPVAAMWGVYVVAMAATYAYYRYKVKQSGAGKAQANPKNREAVPSGDQILCTVSADDDWADMTGAAEFHAAQRVLHVEVDEVVAERAARKYEAELESERYMGASGEA